MTIPAFMCHLKLVLQYINEHIRTFMNINKDTSETFFKIYDQ